MQHRTPTPQQIGPIACIINKQIWSKTLHDPNWTSNLFSNTRTLTHKRPLSMFRQPFFPFDANLDFYYVSIEERKKKKSEPYTISFYVHISFRYETRMVNRG